MERHRFLEYRPSTAIVAGSGKSMTPNDALLRVIDTVLVPLTALSGAWLKFVRRADVSRMPVSRRTLRRIGVFPVRNHYYEPLIDPALLRTSLHADRTLPGIDLNTDTQLSILRRFDFAAELAGLPLDCPSSGAKKRFYFHNSAYGPGDAEYLYSMIRLFRPARIVEVGSGFSTLIAIEAIRANQSQYPDYTCELTCIEPYEQPWLEETGATVVREPVELMPRTAFNLLETNDFLIIDSSHVIRPQGDILCLYHEVLPRLKPGVFVHVHDVFTPRDYPEKWLFDQVKFWNEQYLFEAFLTFNREYRVTGALNYLAHHHQAEFKRVFPIFAAEAPRCEPGAFWIQRS
jgi:predicted O-methyltransferase YrrM